VDRLERMLQEQSIAAKDLKKMRVELTQLLAENLAKISDKYAYLHREELDASFLKAVSYAYSALGSQKPLILTAGPAQGEGLVLISGPEAFVAEHAKVIVNILDGKGGGLKGLFQGKVKNLSNFPLVRTHLDEHFSK
jgi:misacylated tRNA(Ala) deacylase